MLDLTNVGAKIDEEDQAIILLSSLPKPYKNFVDTTLYGRKTLPMSEVKFALNSKELQRKAEMKLDGEGESLMVRGRNLKRNDRQGRKKSTFKSRNSKKCYYCHKEGHFRKDCLERKKMAEKGTDQWILDSGCSYHMSPCKEWFHDFKECNGGQAGSLGQ